MKNPLFFYQRGEEIGIFGWIVIIIIVVSGITYCANKEETAQKPEQQKQEAAKKAEQQKQETAQKAEQQKQETAQKAEQQKQEAAKKAEQQRQEASIADSKKAKAVQFFLEKTNPELSGKIQEISQEISNTESKIKQLSALKDEHPTYANMVDTPLNQWKSLKDQLIETLESINSKVEGAYVAYKINEIQGTRSFNTLSADLLASANAALANAESTKSVIEKQLEQSE